MSATGSSHHLPQPGRRRPTAAGSPSDSARRRSPAASGRRARPATARARSRSGQDQLETAGNLQNLRLAAGIGEGEAIGPVFADSDVYKWLEAAAWEYGRNPTDDLLEAQRELTAVVAAAQREDGYLDSVVQLRYGDEGRYQRLCLEPRALLRRPPDPGRRRPGPLHRRPGAARRRDQARRPPGRDVRRRRRQDRRRRRPPGDRDGPGRAVPRDRYDGATSTWPSGSSRPAATASSRTTATSRPTSPTGSRSARPTTVEGHAVRAVYLAAGATDVALETGDAELLDALKRQFEHMWSTKTYLTGGLGARWEGEAFGDEYELPRGPRVRRDLRGDRRHPVGLADAARHRRGAVRRCRSSGCSTTASSPASRSSGDRVLLRQPAAAARRRARRQRPQPGARPARLVRLRLLPAEHHAHPRQPRRLPRHHRRRRASRSTSTPPGTSDRRATSS